MSWRDILNLCFRHDLIPEVATQEVRCIQIHLAAKNFRKLGLYSEKSQSRHVPRFKLNEHVHVRCPNKIRPEAPSRKRPASGYGASGKDRRSCLDQEECESFQLNNFIKLTDPRSIRSMFVFSFFMAT